MVFGVVLCWSLLLLCGAVCCLLLCVVVCCCLVFGACPLLVLFVDVGSWCCSLLNGGCCSLVCMLCGLLLCDGCCLYGVVAWFAVVGRCVLLVDRSCRVRLFVVGLCVGDCLLVGVCLL